MPESELVRVVLPPPAPYRLGVGDVVYVAVPGQEKFAGFGETATGEVVGTRVKEDGNLYLPLIRTVPAAGRTAIELQEDIRKRLSEFVQEPYVSVDVLEHHSQRFYVFGEVKDPGAFPVDGHTTLLDGLSAAGGPESGTADLDEAYVVRDGNVLPLSLADVLEHGDKSGNLVMRDRDLVFVPHVRDRSEFVYVLGEVKRAGAVPMHVDPARPGAPARMTLAEALAQAGGLDLDTAAQDQIRVFRGDWRCPRAYTLSAHEVYAYGEGMRLEPGDRVLVAPTGLATWGRALKQATPFLSGATTAVAASATVGALK